ncbi:MAG: site-2 protease family protein [Planctomycetaceae bacterium]
MIYRLISYKASWREYLWEGHWILWPFIIPLGLIVKLLRLRLPSSTDVPPVDDVRPFEVAEGAVPANIRAKMRPLEQQLRSLGFDHAVWHLIVDPVHAATICWQTLYDRDGKTMARLHYRNWRGVSPPRTYVFPVFITAFKDGTYLLTSGGKRDMIHPEAVHSEYLTGKSGQAVWERHQQRLGEAFGSTVVTIYSSNDTLDITEELHVVERDFHLERGVFGKAAEQTIELPKPIAPRKPSPALIDYQERKRDETVDAEGEVFDDDDDDELDDEPELPEGTAVPERYAEVVAQLKKQQSSSSWGTAIVLLIVTAVLYVGAGAAQWDWTFLAIVIPVLFIHELGHLIAMWIFRYRNLKMFFIPFFGAAVTGRNHNVVGWKKSLVALAGPLPGIAIGCVVGTVGAFIDNDMLLEIGLLSLLVNGFNLLPLVPLDGGWNLHAVLFVRHPFLDVMFRAAAAVGCIGLGVALQARGMMFVGAWMLLGSMHAYRCGKIAAKLRREKVTFSSTDDGSVPLDAVARIVGELQESSQSYDAKVLATLTLNVYETLNSKPPGWFASLSLLGLHAGSLATAVVFLSVFFVTKHGGGLENVARMIAGQPEQVFVCGSTVSWQGKEFDAAGAIPRNTIVLKRDEEESAARLFDQLSNELPPQTAMRRMSQTLLIGIPDDNAVRQQWLSNLERHDPNVFVITAELPRMVRISCIAENEKAGELLDDELQQYAASTEMLTIPPWEVGDSRDAAERTRHLKARKTLIELNERSIIDYEDPELARLGREQNDASRRGDNEKLKALTKQYGDRMQELREQRRKSMKESPDADWDLDVVTMYFDNLESAKLLGEDATEEQYQEWELQRTEHNLKLGKLLGQLPLQDGKPIPGSDKYALHYGYMSRAGLFLELTFSARDTYEALPTIAGWLCSRGCIEIKFDIISNEFDDDDF